MHRAGKPLPFRLTGGAFFQLGDRAARTTGPDALYVNPTTSTRFNAYMPEIIRACGMTAMGGKGGLDRNARGDAGGRLRLFLDGRRGLAAAIVGVKEVIATAWDDFITQFRLTKLRLEGFGPLTVAIDAHGNSLYAR